MDASDSITTKDLDGAPLPTRFFARSALRVAPELIGTILLTRRDGLVTAGRIVEVEAYLDAKDLASHAARGSGPTARNASMYGPPGRAYVYRIYGMHHCFNVVTECDGIAGAVLVRALEPILGLDAMRRRRGRIDPRTLVTGPGNLCAALAIDRRDDGRPLDDESLRIVASVPDRARRGQISRSPRIGVDYAGRWAKKPYRFFLPGNPFVSGGRSGRRALP